ncbi:hypothetical protein ACFPM0_30895 [Pseudonocardia sulfidoxydans]|uniref:hypothetical protein n=1 Tax=Pseudonocardia sulfidoxydans TaxID=54011 RepID=UPI00361E4201
MRGNSLRIADLRSRLAYISLADSPPDPARRVGPTPPEHHRGGGSSRHPGLNTVRPRFAAGAPC